MRTEKIIGEKIGKYDDFSIIKIYNVFVEMNYRKVLASYGVLHKDRLIDKGNKIVVLKNRDGYIFECGAREITTNYLKDLEEKHRGKIVCAYDVKIDDEYYKFSELTDSFKKEIEDYKLKLKKMVEEVQNENKEV